MNNDLISREALKEVITANHYLLSSRNNSIDYGMFTTGIIQAIDNAPTVEPTFGLFKEMLCSECEKRPQGDLAEKLKDRIEESICKRCQMNEHCELCEISRVFSIIALTDKEMKGGE